MLVKEVFGDLLEVSDERRELTPAEVIPKQLANRVACVYRVGNEEIDELLYQSLDLLEAVTAPEKTRGVGRRWKDEVEGVAAAIEEVGTGEEESREVGPLLELLLYARVAH